MAMIIFHRQLELAVEHLNLSDFMISFIYWNQLSLQLGLVNTDKVNLITLLLENIEIYHKHNKRIEQYLEQKNVTENCCNDEAPSSNYADQNGEGNDKNVCATDATNADKQKLPKKVSLAVHPYEPIQAIPGASHGFLWISYPNQLFMIFRRYFNSVKLCLLWPWYDSTHSSRNYSNSIRSRHWPSNYIYN